MEVGNTDFPTLGKSLKQINSKRVKANDLSPRTTNEQELKVLSMQAIDYDSDTETNDVQ